MKIFITILFLSISLLFPSTLQNFFDVFTSIEKDELDFLETLMEDKPLPALSNISPQRLIKKETLEKKVLLEEKIIFLEPVSMVKKEVTIEEKKYLKLQKALLQIQNERQKRKAFLQVLKEDIFKGNKNSSKFELKSKKFYKEQEQRKIKRQKNLQKAKKKKRLAYMQKQKVLLKLKHEIKKRKLKKKLLEKRRKQTVQKGSIKVKIMLSTQRMKVFKNNKLLYKWKVSTARKGHKTPKGNFKVQLMKKMHYSSLYNNAPMPYTIFYDGNYAIHGTSKIRKLGRPASHGCVRLHTRNAKKLYTLVRKNGKKNMSIEIVR